MKRRLCLLLSLPPWWRAAAAAPAALEPALARAHALRDEAVRSGDQAYGAVVWSEGVIVGEAPSRVIAKKDWTAHAEREALRDAQQRLGRENLSGCVLVSSSRPCAMCENAAARAGIARMVYGEGVDAGPPRLR
jgi:tRNA(Arg) A34 adenosine deaminase TadA